MWSESRILEIQIWNNRYSSRKPYSPCLKLDLNINAHDQMSTASPYLFNVYRSPLCAQRSKSHRQVALIVSQNQNYIFPTNKRDNGHTFSFFVTPPRADSIRDERVVNETNGDHHPHPSVLISETSPPLVSRTCSSTRRSS